MRIGQSGKQILCSGINYTENHLKREPPEIATLVIRASFPLCFCHFHLFNVIKHCDQFCFNIHFLLRSIWLKRIYLWYATIFFFYKTTWDFCFSTFFFYQPVVFRVEFFFFYMKNKCSDNWTEINIIILLCSIIIS